MAHYKFYLQLCKSKNTKPVLELEFTAYISLGTKAHEKECGKYGPVEAELVTYSTAGQGLIHYS